MKKKFLLGLVAMLLPWTAWAQAQKRQFDVTGVESTYEYAGVRTLEPAVKAYDQSLTEGTHYTVTYKFGGETTTEIKKVGNYEVTIAGAKGTVYENLDPTTIEFEITPKTVDNVKLLLGDAEKPYGAKDLVALKDLVTGVADLNNQPLAWENVLVAGADDTDIEDFLGCLQVNRYGDDQVGEAVKDGGYTVFVSGQTGDNINSNYRFTTTSTGSYATLTITPATLTVTVTGKPYDGIEVTTFIPVVQGILSKEGVQDDVTVTLSAGNQTVKNAATYELTATLSGDDAGNYTVGTVYYTISKVDLTIAATTTAINPGMGKTFGNKDSQTNFLSNQTYFTINGFVTGESATTIHLGMKREAGENAGEYGVYPYNTTTGDKIQEGAYKTALTNYNLVMAKNVENVKYTIGTKGLNSYTNPITLAVTDFDLTYQGEKFTVPAVSVTATYSVMDQSVIDVVGSNVLKEGRDYTIEVTAVNGTATNANEQFKVTIKATAKDEEKGTSGNYNGTLIYQVDKTDKVYTITKAPLTIALKGGVESPSMEYAGNDEPDMADYFEIDGWKNETDENESGLLLIRHGHGSEKANEHYANAWDIYLFKNVENEETDLIEDNLVGTLETLKGTVNEDALDNYTITYDGDETKFVIEKKPMTYWIASAKKQYDATNALTNVEVTYGYKIDNEEETATAAEFAKFFEDVDEAYLQFTGVAPVVALAEGEAGINVNAEKYTLTVSNKDNVLACNYELTLDEEKKNQYEITPRDLTIVVNDQDMDFGLTAEERAAKLALWAGWNGGDGNGTDIKNFTEAEKNNKGLSADRTAIRDMYTLDFSDEVQKAGYASGPYKEGIGLVWNTTLTDAQKAILANYGGTDEIDVTKGDLTIDGVSALTLDGSEGLASEETEVEEAEEPEATELTNVEKLQKYNGAKVTTVTVTNLVNYVGTLEDAAYYEPTTTFEATNFYTLTLPFSVKVRDLATQLGGYAVVYVPDTEKSGKNGAFFKVEMVEVPANTLMLFRVDQNNKFEQMAFTDATIEASDLDEEGKIHNTYNDVDFVSVYKKTSLTSADDWFLWPDASTFYSTEWFDEGELNVYPLNGYVSFKNPYYAARIYVEGADGTVTAINTVTGKAVNNNAEGWYTIGGVKLNGEPTQKGIYINNGKKVVIK